MVDIIDTPASWVPVDRVEVSDLALGGNEVNVPNRQFKALAQRDNWLRAQLGSSTESIDSFNNFKQAGIAALAQGRLTFAAGNPLPSTSLTAQTTLYYTPYVGDLIGLWNGTEWIAYPFTERSLSLTGLAANTNFDIFAFFNAGAVTLQAVAWSNSGAGTSTRAQALTRLNGILVKASDNRRYLGTIRTVAAGQSESSPQNRYLWNAENREPVDLNFQPSGTNYSYTTAAWRAMNASTVNQVRVVSGLPVPLNVFAGLVTLGNGATAEPSGYVGIGMNSTTANSAQVFTDRALTSDQFTLYATATLIPPIGHSFFQILEWGGPNLFIAPGSFGAGITAIWFY